MSDYEGMLDDEPLYEKVAEGVEKEMETACFSYLADRIHAKTYTKSSMVCLVCKDTLVKYYIHQDLLCVHSIYFRDKCRHSKSDSLLEIVEDVSQDVLELIIAWLYNKYIPLPTTSGEVCALVGAWEVATRYGMENCGNTILDAYRGYLLETNHLPKEQRNVKVLSGDLFVVDRFLWEMMICPETHVRERDWLDAMWKRGGDLVSNLMTEFYMSQPEEKGIRDPARVSGCAFHIHENGSKCQAMILSQENGFVPALGVEKSIVVANAVEKATDSNSNGRVAESSMLGEPESAMAGQPVVKSVDTSGFSAHIIEKFEAQINNDQAMQVICRSKDELSIASDTATQGEQDWRDPPASVPRSTANSAIRRKDDSCQKCGRAPKKCRCNLKVGNERPANKSLPPCSLCGGSGHRTKDCHFTAKSRRSWEQQAPGGGSLHDVSTKVRNGHISVDDLEKLIEKTKAQKQQEQTSVW